MPILPFGRALVTADATTGAIGASARIGAAQVAASAGVATLGDSITDYNSGADHVWHKYGCMRTGQHLRHDGFFATPGHTLEQIESVHLPKVLAMTPRPGACIIAGGTNNTGNPTQNLSDYAPVLARMIETLRDAGITPILWTVPPRSDDVDANKRAAMWNVHVKTIAKQMGLAVVDAHAALTDPATGKFRTNYVQADGIHPNDAGHAAIGELMAADQLLMQAVKNGAPYLADSTADPANLAPALTSWAWNNGYTNTTVPDSASPTPWTRISVPASTAAASGGMQAVAGGIVGGHKYQIAARIRSDHKGTTDNRFTLPVDFVNAAGASVLSSTIGGTQYSATQVDGVIQAVLTAPSGATQIKLTAQITTNRTTTSAQTFDFTQLTVVDLTAAGIA